MPHRDDSAPAIALRADARALFPDLDAAAIRAKARSAGTMESELASDAQSKFRPAYRLDLRPGSTPSGLLVQAELDGSVRNAHGFGVLLSCYPYSNDALLGLLSSMGHSEAVEFGSPSKARITLDADSTWDVRNKAATSVSRLLVQACLWEEADASHGDASCLRSFIPDPKPADAQAQAPRKKRDTGL